MADISKIKPNGANGTEYDIKDAAARQTLSQHGTAAYKNINNTYSPTSEDVATGKTIADAFDYFGFSIVNGKLCQTYTT